MMRIATLMKYGKKMGSPQSPSAAQIAELEKDVEANRSAITQIGKRFSLVTKYTSLLVLDRVEDYVEHEILPPPSLQKRIF